ncbi:Zn-dependent protease [Anoxybacillus rupiensis]|nr:Zn-dependent protease [Anoxybacillus rupiensis]
MTRMKKAWVTIGTVGLFMAGKLKWLLALAKFLKLSSLISLFISFGLYALVYGWKFAVALIYLIYVHEMGHLMAARKKDIPTSKAIFLPFIGAVVALKKQPESANDEAYLAYAGPLWGTLAFLPAFPLYWMTEDPFWGLVIALGAIINLFNLLPIHPLDGGRIVGVISPKIWFFGLIGGALYWIWRPNGILALILLFGAMKCWELMRQAFRYEMLKVEQKADKHALEQLEAYRSATEQEQYEMRRKWAEEQSRMEIDRKRYVPVIQDQQKLRKHQALIYKENLDLLLNATSFWMIDEEKLLKAKDELEEAIRDGEEAMRKEKVYYASDTKTKWLWLVLYIGLGAFLLACTMYGQSLLDRYQSIIS